MKLEKVNLQRNYHHIHTLNRKKFQDQQVNKTKQVCQQTRSQLIRIFFYLLANICTTRKEEEEKV